MQKIFKKSLALAVSAALCLTAFIGCLSVNAEGGSGTITVGTVEANPGDTAKVPVTLTKTTGIGIAGSRFVVTYDSVLTLSSIDDVSADFMSSYNNDGEGLPIPKENEDGTKSIVILLETTKQDVSALEKMELALNFAVSETAEAGSKAITLSEVVACDSGTIGNDGKLENNEAYVDLAVTDGAVVIANTPEEPIYDASVKIMGKNGLFESDYSLLYYVPASLSDSWYISVNKAVYNGNTRVADEMLTLTMDDVFDTVTMVGSDYYRVALKGIAAKEVANEITATLHKVVDGVDYYGDSLEYNLVTYAEARIAANKPKEVAALAAFLNYATATQKRFNYNTDNLANASLTDEQKVVTPVSEITDETRNDNYIVIEEETAHLRGFAPSYEDKMTLVTMFDASDEIINAGAKIKYEYSSNTINKVEYINLSEGVPFTGAAGVLQLSFTGLAIKEVRTPVLVTIVDSENNAISNTRRYSFEVYAASRKESSADYESARAMIAFGDLFKAFKEG